MTFWAKATLIILAFWSLTEWVWNIQEHHPWRALAIVLVVCACVIVIELKKGKR